MQAPRLVPLVPWPPHGHLATHLVDDVLPEVPLRQWVCSLPWAMRCMLAFDRALCADVLDVFIAALTRSLKWRAKRHFSLRSVDDALVGALPPSAPRSSRTSPRREVSSSPSSQPG